MTLSEQFLAQLVDPFRIVLTIGLVITMMRTRTVSGTWVPLAAGVVFVAVLIPLTIEKGKGDLVPAIGVGLLSTGLLTVVAFWIATLVLRDRGR